MLVDGTDVGWDEIYQLEFDPGSMYRAECNSITVLPENILLNPMYHDVCEIVDILNETIKSKDLC